MKAQFESCRSIAVQLRHSLLGHIETDLRAEGARLLERYSISAKSSPYGVESLVPPQQRTTGVQFSVP